ncbi:YdhG-like domain-containing protein OS=Bosea thiooxidans OX=53254 GN=ARD30_12820 PE=4 SV=1 [Bosea thiooxidans]
MAMGAAQASPDGYVAALAGWQRMLVERLRKDVLAAAPLDERIKWTHLIYFSNGPVLLIRAEAKRVLFGFWRGKRLREIAPRLKPGGKFELATWELREGNSVDADLVAALVREAVRLNAELGNPAERSA